MAKLARPSRETLRTAAGIARLYGHGYVGSQHLLLALLARPEEKPARILAALGLSLSRVRSMTALLWGCGAPGVPLPQGLSPKAAKILGLASVRARQDRCRKIWPEHILTALAQEPATAAFPPRGSRRRRRLGKVISNRTENGGIPE